MMLIANYCPKECRVCPSSHGLKIGGFVRQESTPSRPTEKAFQVVQVGFIQDTPPSWGCVQHSCECARWPHAVTSNRAWLGITRDRIKFWVRTLKKNRRWMHDTKPWPSWLSRLQLGYICYTRTPSRRTLTDWRQSYTVISWHMRPDACRPTSYCRAASKDFHAVCVKDGMDTSNMLWEELLKRFRNFLNEIRCHLTLKIIIHCPFFALFWKCGIEYLNSCNVWSDEVYSVKFPGIVENSFLNPES